MGNSTSENQGEGNRTADRNYRKATEKFVNSERGQREIGKAGQVSPAEQKELQRAEEAGKAHAKGSEPAERAKR